MGGRRCSCSWGERGPTFQRTHCRIRPTDSSGLRDRVRSDASEGLPRGCAPHVNSPRWNPHLVEGFVDNTSTWCLWFPHQDGARLRNWGGARSREASRGTELTDRCDLFDGETEITNLFFDEIDAGLHDASRIKVGARCCRMDLDPGLLSICNNLLSIHSINQSFEKSQSSRTPQPSTRIAPPRIRFPSPSPSSPRHGLPHRAPICPAIPLLPPTLAPPRCSTDPNRSPDARPLPGTLP